MWAFAYTDGNGYGNGCSVGNCNGYGYSNADAYRVANTEDYANSAGASDSPASAVSLRAYMQLSSGTREAIREFPKSRDLLYREARVKPKIKTECVVPNAFAKPRHY